MLLSQIATLKWIHYKTSMGLWCRIFFEYQYGWHPEALLGLLDELHGFFKDIAANGK